MRVKHWRQTIEPFASAWRAIERGASMLGLVHGMVALDHLRGNYSPADVASLLADMVAAGVVRPLCVDASGPHMHSVIAFRGIGPSAGGKLPSAWARADAHVWTYEIGRAPDDVMDTAR